MRKITKHLSYREVTKSWTAIKHGINNEPDSKQLDNIARLAKEIFESVRMHFNVPIGVVSCFRSFELNKLIGGANGSQHLADNDCAAIDLDADIYGQITNRAIFNYIKDNLEFDQLIYEFGDDNDPDWIHVSLAKEKNRNQILQAKKIRNKIYYDYYENN